MSMRFTSNSYDSDATADTTPGLFVNRNNECNNNLTTKRSLVPLPASWSELKLASPQVAGNHICFVVKLASCHSSRKAQEAAQAIVLRISEEVIDLDLVVVCLRLVAFRFGNDLDFHRTFGRSPFRPRLRKRSSNGYLLIATSEGLNQQKIGITDAVVDARILNATLAVPELNHHSFGKDDSDFVDILDVNWFISSLAKDGTVVKRIQDKVMRLVEKRPYTSRVPRKSSPDYYLDQVLPLLLRSAVQLAKVDYRLANNYDEELEKLCCRVNYQALRFTKSIRELGQNLVMRMQMMEKWFIDIHLRFEPDMQAFSDCYYGGGHKERNESGKIRKSWPTLPDLSPEGERKQGKCPPTPPRGGFDTESTSFQK
ncbi:hypothetical protein GIB67_018236 [Kingdonia uniflora]|uniref:O-fucosyltransferase family protein n=1 Tax=Kingdonia uniflora TaxID=39325 RepID=A0A7J7NMM8_9MAGN|nr:hypothetical protein GIB67_018236 [Kingdonia uniflora]